MSQYVLFCLQVQDKLLLSACHLLVSLATTVRPVFLISIPAVQKVFNRITDASAQRLIDKVRPRGQPAAALELHGSDSGRPRRRRLALLLLLEFTGHADRSGFLHRWHLGQPRCSADGPFPRGRPVCRTHEQLLPGGSQGCCLESRPCGW